MLVILSGARRRAKRAVARSRRIPAKPLPGASVRMRSPDASPHGVHQNESRGGTDQSVFCADEARTLPGNCLEAEKAGEVSSRIGPLQSSGSTLCRNDSNEQATRHRYSSHLGA